MPPVMATAGSPVVEKHASCHASCHGYGGESCSGKACLLSRLLSWLRRSVLKWKSMPPVTATVGSPVVEKHASCHGYGGESCSGKACLLSWLRRGVL
ncbi:Hypp890 [Branchiostoma lanceolatum]|uniref:Hypp890 protein n=1 Tax=Branchiostoma lanceolatum TaxID=7740 RepID=A0A8J9VCW5_BRALA|nr:Hypp890 [Branchiostoma lanceolatum]